MTYVSAHRVLALFNERTAKAKYLKAIDYSIGLVKRLERMGKNLTGGNSNIVDRLVFMRKIIPKGFDPYRVLENKNVLRGAGEKLLTEMEQLEQDYTPNDEDLASFVRPFPNTVRAAVLEQADMLRAAIAKTTGQEIERVDDLLIDDEKFYMKAYDAIRPIMDRAVQELNSTFSGFKGEYKSRPKGAPNARGKQTRVKNDAPSRVPLIYFKDLAGCMLITPNVSEMARAVSATQKNFPVLEKQNFYLEGRGYNAVHFNIQSSDGLVVEIQIKTKVNALEAGLSHDLIYAKEKRIHHLSAEEEELVKLAIDVSTQLDLKDFAEEYDIQQMQFTR